MRTSILMNSGFTKVRPLHGGLEAWIAAGYEVEELPAAERAIVARDLRRALQRGSR